MLQLAWRGVRHNPGRYIATIVAIITGVAFFAATGFVSDRVIATLEGDVNRQYGNVDVAVVVDTDGPKSDFAEDQRIDGDAAADILAVPGVEAGEGIVTGNVAFLEPDGSVAAQGATGRLWVADEQLNPVRIVEGAAPTAPGQVAISKDLADSNGLAVGDSVTVLTLAGEQPATVVGITRFGASDSVDSGGTVHIPAPAAFDWLTSGAEEYEALFVRGSGSQADLAAAIEPLTPPGFEVQSGEDFLADQRASVGSAGRALKIALQAFAMLALLVGGFVIYNTFSVIVSQRLRELAVLAAVGATPKQIKRSLRFEGLVIGVIGSLLGVVVGVALTFVLIAVLELLGVSLPGSGIEVRPSNVVGAVILGTGITLFSVMTPARRAAKTEPIEALRAAAVERSPFSSKRVFASVVIVGLGLLLVIGGLSNPGAAAFGGLVLFIGVIVAGPIIAVLGARLVSPLMSALGLEGRLAADNAARNPKRTATTANALLIGVFLVTLVTVAGTSFKDFVVGEIKKLESADFLIESKGGTIDDQLVSDLEAIEGVSAVAPFRTEVVTQNDEPGRASAGDLALVQKVAGIEAVAGSFTDLQPGTVAVIEDAQAETPLTLGDTVTLTTNTGNRVDLRVAVVMKNTIDTAYTGSLVTAEDLDQLAGATAPTFAFLDLVQGAQTDTKDAIEDLTATRPDIVLTEGNFLGRVVANIFDFMINAVNGLLMMSVIVALIGIVNTLSLSILERRRELGLLRAVGMTDRRVQKMVRLESLLISALGTVTGLLLGLVVGWALVRSVGASTDAGVGFSFPAGHLLLVLVLGTVLGLLASLIPARRSTRLDVLESIQAT